MSTPTIRELVTAHAHNLETIIAVLELRERMLRERESVQRIILRDRGSKVTISDLALAPTQSED